MSKVLTFLQRLNSKIDNFPTKNKKVSLNKYHRIDCITSLIIVIQSIVFMNSSNKILMLICGILCLLTLLISISLALVYKKEISDENSEEIYNTIDIFLFRIISIVIAVTYCVTIFKDIDIHLNFLSMCAIIFSIRFLKSGMFIIFDTEFYEEE